MIHESANVSLYDLQFCRFPSDVISYPMTAAVVVGVTNLH